MPIPSSGEWKQALAQAIGSTPVLSLPDGFLVQFMTEVLEACDTLKDDFEEMGKRARATVCLFAAAARWLSKAGSKYKTGPNTGEVRMGRTEPLGPLITHLRDDARKVICEGLDIEDSSNMSDKQILKALAEVFGKDNTLLESDQAHNNQLKPLIYLEDDQSRFNYKIRFRGGIAYRMATLLANEQNDWTAYDTEKSGEAESEQRPTQVHYAMDYRGRLYSGFVKNDATFYHSSLVGGERVLSAGTLAMKDGRLTYIDIESGHYKPKPHHLAMALQHLRLHGVDLSGVEVRGYGGSKQPAFDFLAEHVGIAVKNNNNNNNDDSSSSSSKAK